MSEAEEPTNWNTSANVLWLACSCVHDCDCDTVEEALSFGSDAISDEETTPSDNNNCYFNSDRKVLEASLTGVY